MRRIKKPLIKRNLITKLRYTVSDLDSYNVIDDKIKFDKAIINAEKILKKLK